MTFTTTSLDLRSPVLKQVSKGTLLAGFRVMLLLSIDSTFLALAWLVAQTSSLSLESHWGTQNQLFSMLPILATEIGLISVQGFFESKKKRRDYFSLIKTISISHICLLLLDFFYEPEQLIVSRSTFLLSWALALAFTCAGRFVFNGLVDNLRQRGAGLYPVFLIGSPEDTKKANMLLEKENRYNILGWADVSSADKQKIQILIDTIRSLGVAEVFLCSWGPIQNRMFLYWNLRNAGITLHTLPIGLEPLYQQAELWMVGGLPTIKSSPPLITGIDFWIKRCFDFCCAAIALILASPLYLAIALLIKLDSPGPVFYKQTRIGLHGEQFKVWKFRTMVPNADQLQKELEARNEMKDGVLFKIKDDPRITRVGKVLRQYSLDELPQLFNVLFGQMSLVGPRPLPLRDVENFAEHHFLRHEVLPGITGLWQVSGRSDITSFEEAVRLDTIYIENWSLWLDLKILLKTVEVIFQKRGAY